MFPAKVDAETLKKLSLAPKNESMVINVLRFLGFINEQGEKTKSASDVFQKHTDDAFATALEKAVKGSYAELFSTIGDEAWTIDRDSLIGFFRVHDETSALTAKRQAIAFETLSALSGHGETPTTKAGKSKVAAKKKVSTKKKDSKREEKDEKKEKKVVVGNIGENDIGLTVRIEINLPAQGDQETYDRIFQSIRKNLLNG